MKPDETVTPTPACVPNVGRTLSVSDWWQWRSGDYAYARGTDALVMLWEWDSDRSAWRCLPISGASDLGKRESKMKGRPQLVRHRPEDLTVAIDYPAMEGILVADAARLGALADVPLAQVIIGCGMGLTTPDRAHDYKRASDKQMQEAFDAGAITEETLNADERGCGVCGNHSGDTIHDTSSYGAPLEYLGESAGAVLVSSGVRPPL